MPLGGNPKLFPWPVIFPVADPQSECTVHSAGVMLCPALMLTRLQLHFLAELDCSIQEIKYDHL